MKHLYKYLTMGALALSMTACNDSFLDRTPTNDLNDKAFGIRQRIWKLTVMEFIMKPEIMDRICL